MRGERSSGEDSRPPPLTAVAEKDGPTVGAEENDSFALLLEWGRDRLGEPTLLRRVLLRRGSMEGLSEWRGEDGNADSFGCG